MNPQSNPIIFPESDPDLMKHMLQNKFPFHQKHWPTYLLPYMEGYDCPYISLGLGQWRGHGESPLSLKTWRVKADGNFGRMSEEMPAIRHIDLAILAVLADAQNYPERLTVPAEAEFPNQKERWVLKRFGDPRDRKEKENLHKRIDALMDVLVHECRDTLVQKISDFDKRNER